MFTNSLLQKNYRRNGFILIELILYTSISAIMLLIIFFFLSALLTARIKNQTIAEIEQQGLHIMQIVTQSVRNAEAITAPALGVSASSLTLDVITNTDDPTVFYLSGTAIHITEGANSSIVLTNNRVMASALNFQNLSRSSTPGNIRIAFTLTHINPDGKNEYDYSKTFYGSASLRQP